MIGDGAWTTRRERKKRVQQPRYRGACLGELGEVVIEHKGVALPARKFLKDARVNQAAVADNEILGPLLAEIQRRQQERDAETLATTRLTLREEDLMRKDMGKEGLPTRRNRVA